MKLGNSKHGLCVLGFSVLSCSISVEFHMSGTTSAGEDRYSDLAQIWNLSFCDFVILSLLYNFLPHLQNVDKQPYPKALKS